MEESKENEIEMDSSTPDKNYLIFLFLGWMHLISMPPTHISLTRRTMFG